MMTNKKGFTIVELVLSFIIISIIVLGMLTIALQYQDKTTASSVKLSLDTYKNTIARAVGDDIVKYGVSNVTSDGNQVRIDYSNGINKTISIEDSKTLIYKNTNDNTGEAYELDTGELDSIVLENNNNNIFNIIINIKNPELESDYKIVIVGTIG